MKQQNIFHNFVLQVLCLGYFSTRALLLHILCLINASRMSQVYRYTLYHTTIQRTHMLTSVLLKTMNNQVTSIPNAHPEQLLVALHQKV